MKIKTADLIGPALDWAVGVAENMPIHVSKQTKFPTFNKVLCRMGDDDSTDFRAYTPSTSWSQGGQIIEKQGVYLRANDAVTEWAAGALSRNRLDKQPGPLFYAKTPLIAAMRCFVASRLGDEVEIPEELLK